MSIKISSAQIVGLEGKIIEIEVDLTRGLPAFSIVGLPDKAIEESKERISSAVKNSGFNPPQRKNQRVTVSLAPADLKKEGPGFDLGIALGYLLASKQLNFNADKKLFLGELALNGSIRIIRGALALAQSALKAGFEEIYLPKGNGKEAAFIEGIKVYEAGSLLEIASWFEGKIKPEPLPKQKIQENASEYSVDLSDIRGQEHAKRALEISAAGSHNLLMVGPPGTGKTMLAKALPSLLPPLSFEEALEATNIHSIAGTLDKPLLTFRPFRNPHHTASYISIIGGGTIPRPGEITMAHRGVLFLDEFPEFDRRVIESLRQPIEDGVIAISRAKGVIVFPARIILVCAMNPCPCGNLGSKNKSCLCPASAIFKYQRKISGPIADRLDLFVEVGRIEHEELSKKNSAPTSAEKQKLILKAREVQKERFKNRKILTNAEMSSRDLEQFVPLDRDSQRALNLAASRMDLSARAYHRVIKIARTIADLENSESVRENHIAEALQYRPKQSLI
ncbi:MAG: magnesium chelatase [Candidatus Niyogibacteria bacterium RIFCSPLOWO2_12_FULL_41_13]|uniref:Magnesium chelatase n=1 Tax=Candidatus Niyogibacteria bacterium RIFCSPLOWO2_12_FULL_41_13 TaxID=1801726 RepID=A0A1G2F104_9BACT|nr:MAG: magnesium chelatase [Candidatus Niyogibacteria bacterium RIFCSPLOWO2_12_FULL_41_13]